MLYCPNCGHSVSTGVRCPACRFDLSRDYLRYPTLIPLAESDPPSDRPSASPSEPPVRAKPSPSKQGGWFTPAGEF